MKYSKLCIAVISGLVVVLACNKAIKDPQTAAAATSASSFSDLISGASLGEYDKYVSVISSYTINPIKRDSSYTVQAFGRIVQNGVAVNAGPLTIGSKVIYPGANNLYFYDYTLSEGKALFGATVNCQISDSATGGQAIVRAPGITRTVMVVPKELFPSTMSLPGNTVNRLSNYTLTWQADPSNQFHKVQIQVSYLKGISQHSDVSMPNSITDLVYSVADNGSYTIPQADIARFPKGAFITISIARGWLDNTTSSVAYVSVVEAHTVPLLVDEPPPPPAPLINGQSTFYYTASVRGGSGQITAIPGTVVTVTVGASGAPPGSYSASCIISGASYSDGTTGIFVTNTSQSKTFVMPATGRVNWSGTFSEPNTTGAGYVRVN